MMIKKVILLCLVVFQSWSIYGQAVENKSTLTIPQIMQGEKFIGYSPSNIFWSDDSKSIYFTWNPKGEKVKSLYKIGVNDAKPTLVTVEEQQEMPSSRGVFNEARTQKVYTKNGDVFLLNVASNENKQITNTLDYEFNPLFSGDEKHIIYTKSNNLYRWNIAEGTTTQLTDFQKGSKKSEKKLPSNEQWLNDDQLEHFEILNHRKEVRELQKEQREALKPNRPKTIYYGKKSIGNIRISPNLKYVTYRLTKRASAKSTKVPEFVTESGYLNDLRSRSKVGSPQSTYEMGVYDIEKDTSFVLDTKQIEGIYDKPAFLKEYHKDTSAFESLYKKPRKVIFHGPIFSSKSEAIIEIKALDNKDRWIMSLDLGNGKMTLLERQHDDAWIGGPGIVGWNGVPGNVGWLNEESIFYQSEKTGYSHLYCMNLKSGQKKQLTKGDFEIIEADLSNDKKHFYITSNKENAHEHHFYKMPVKGGKMMKITDKVGGHQVVMSPDEQRLAIRFSTSNQPWELFLMENKAKAAMTQLTNSTTADFKKYKWRQPKIVYFTAADGVKVPARLYEPEGEKKTKSAVVFVHGAGYLQNVHQWWSGYYREFMFHNILVDNGYTVLDIDYRASNGYGRDWRTAIYRHMGGKDLSDQIDGAKYLTEELDIDKDKIGIYGGSYGGFITLMALFNEPNTFKSGAALRSVTDWAHYNHAYTSNILNTPAEDSIAYRRSSPIYHAAGLQNQLLILHGMIDTNVQFQDVVRLSQRLIELGKDDWEMAVFPMERHGFVEPSSWSDEYKRIFKLFQTTLK
ncbi:MAG: prolyl oligopeptidase family serine peptidase [Saprospiraceae bacterium]